MHRTKCYVPPVLAILAAIGMPANCQDNYQLIYDATSGGITIDVSPSLSPITAFEVRSNSGAFTGTRPEFFSGFFDIFKPEKLFWLNVDGFGTTDFGPVATPGLELSYLASDLCVSGAVLPSGSLTDVTLVDAASNTELPIFGCSLVDRPDAVVLEYDSATGEVSHRVFPHPRDLVALYIQSSTSPFVESDDPIGTYDAYTSGHLLKFNLDGFGDGSLGSVLPVGLNDLSGNEFCAAGRFADGQLDSVVLNGAPLPLCRSFDLAINDFKDLPDSSQPTTMNYFSASGRLVVEPPDDRSIVALGIESASGAMRRVSRQTLNRRVSPGEAFFLASGLSDLQNTEVQLPEGLTREALLADLTFAGKYDNGTDIGEFVLDVISPPPVRRFIHSVTRIGDGDANVVLAHEIGTTVPIGIEDVTSQVELPQELIGGDQVILSAADIGSPATYQLETGRLGLLYIAIDDRDLNQPFEWMADTDYTGLPAPFFDTGRQLNLDINEDGVADEVLSLWCTIAPPGFFTIGPNTGEHQMMILGTRNFPIPEPTAAFTFVAGLAGVSLLGRRRSRDGI